MWEEEEEGEYIGPRVYRQIGFLLLLLLLVCLRVHLHSVPRGATARHGITLCVKLQLRVSFHFFFKEERTAAGAAETDGACACPAGLAISYSPDDDPLALKGLVCCALLCSAVKKKRRRPMAATNWVHHQQAISRRPTNRPTDQQYRLQIMQFGTRNIYFLSHPGANSPTLNSFSSNIDNCRGKKVSLKLIES